MAGISFFLGGPLLSGVAALFLPWAASRGEGGLVAVFVCLVGLGGVLGFVGFVMLIVATHRALVKIDALPVRAQSASRQDWLAGSR